MLIMYSYAAVMVSHTGDGGGMRYADTSQAPVVAMPLVATATTRDRIDRHKEAIRMTAQQKYIKRIRNAAKREYATKYLTWLNSGRLGPEPNRGELGGMAAQAVMLDLLDLQEEP